MKLSTIAGKSRVRSKQSVRLSRPPFARMMRLHTELSANRYPNCRKIAEDLEVTPKTIQRDIDYMRDQFQLPIEYDQLKFGFYYTRKVENFPQIEVSESELVALFVAEKAVAQYQGTPFEKPLKSAFEKITASLHEKVSFQFTEVDAAISFRGIGATVADIDLFEAVSKATLRSAELEFSYKKLNSSKYETRRVQPYHLGCVEKLWYLFGYDLVRRQIRTFALPRMKKVRETGAGFQRPADFSISEHLGASFGVFTGKGTFKIKIRFDAFAAQLIGEREWHNSQKLKKLADGALEMALKLQSLEEIERWILSWGRHARVLEPAVLIDRLQSTARHLTQIYR